MPTKTIVRIYRGILATILIFFVTTVVLVLTGYFIFTHKSLPQVQGQLAVPGLARPVKVIRDQWGVPHIYAESKADLFFASGFVQAQDRLFQMDLLRRVCEGRLSEWVGKDALSSDRFSRVIGFHRQAKNNLAHLDPESRKLLDSYVAGINAWAAIRATNLPLEYQALKVGMAPWQAEDTLAVALYIGWGLTMNWQVEVLRLALREERDEKTAEEVMPLYDGQGPNILGPEAYGGRTVGEAGPAPYRTASRMNHPQLGRVKALAPLSAGVAELLSADRDFRRMINPATTPLASNSWAVDGTLTASGKPILANDPHLELTLPSVWYELHLVGDGLDVMGVTFPGIPMVVLGHNRKIAWAATTTCADMDDLYIEEVDPSDPNRYKYQGAWVPFELVPETIQVKDDQTGKMKEEKLMVRVSRHGPVINDALTPPVKIKPTLSLAWTGFEPADSLAAFLGVNQAQDWEGFRQNIQRLQCPVQNWVYADAAGHIAYIAAGLYPARPKHDGSFPVSGSSGEFEWQGWIGLDRLPQVKDPAAHYLVTANNQVAPAAAFPYAITGNYGPPYRAQRIVSLLTKDPKPKWTAADLAQIQMDTLSLRAVRLLPIFLAVLEKHRSSDDDLERAFRQLKDWDGNMTKDSPAATIFDQTYFEAMKLTYQDEMSPELWKWMIGVEFVEYAFDNLLAKGDSRLFDDRKTPAVETRDEIILAAFKAAIKTLSASSSPRMSTWQWGNYHQLRLTHPLGQAPELKKLADFLNVNRGPAPMPGGRNTVANGFYFYGEDFSVRVGPSMRHLIDFGVPDQATMAYPGGQSGQPFSPHYADLLPLWLKGEGHPMLMDQKAIAAGKKAELRLTPK